MAERVQPTDARGWGFGSAAEVAGLLSGVGYLADEHTCSVLRLAGQLGKPVLIEGSAGTGKTALATSAAVSWRTGAFRPNCQYDTHAAMPQAAASATQRPYFHNPSLDALARSNAILNSAAL